MAIESGARCRIVLIHRYFWPDTPPYAHILKEIACHLGEQGHGVTVLTCQPSYNRAVVGRAAPRERIGDNVDVRRWGVLNDRASAALKAVNLFVFCCRLLLSMWRFRDVDIVMAASSPPIAVAKVASWVASANGAKFVYHKQDVYPEVVVAPGILRKPRLARLLRWVDSRTEQRAERVVVLSADMLATVRQRGTAGSRISIINNFDPWPSTEPAAGHAEGVSAPHGEPMKVVFAGNLGRFQNLETLTEAMVELGAASGIEFHFYGHGAMQAHIRDAAERNGLQNVWMHGYRQPNEIAKVLRDDADLGLVSLAPGVIRAAYPSKTMSYLRHGCPVLAMVESDSELAASLERSGAGFQVDPHASSIVAMLRTLSENRQMLSAARDGALRMYRESFSRERQLDRWRALFEEVGASP